MQWICSQIVQEVCLIRICDDIHYFQCTLPATDDDADDDDGEEEEDTEGGKGSSCCCFLRW